MFVARRMDAGIEDMLAAYQASETKWGSRSENGANVAYRPTKIAIC